MTRAVTARYCDPLDAIWLGAAARLGLRVERSADVYASTDGRGTLRVAPPEHLDGDDCLAQIILHELCHALVQGEGSFAHPDWGLDNDEQGQRFRDDAVREHACLRTQAALLRRYGLRTLLAPTTDFRAYYDALPADPLAGAPGDRSVAMARAALGRAARAPFRSVLFPALRATAEVHRLAAAAPPPLGGGPPTLWRAAPPPALHPTGNPLAEQSGAGTCGTCAWSFRSGSTLRCRRSEDGGRPRRVEEDWAACALHEPPLDCQACAACCRHAYDVVLLGHREPVARRHPQLVEHDGATGRLRRDLDGRCAALTGPEAGPWACTIYQDRPRACRDFPVGGDSCLEARRRVGLTV